MAAGLCSAAAAPLLWLLRETARYGTNRSTRTYLSCVEILEKVVFSWVPRPLTTAIIATEMPAAISPYSIAVAAD